MTQDEFVDAIKTTAISMGVKGVMSWLIEKSAFWAYPLVNPLVAIIVEQILAIAIKYTELGIFIIRTDIITSEQARKFEDAALRNREIQEDSNATDKDRAAAELAQINAARDCIKYTR